MEDILASIRRIIADDQSDAPPAPGAAARQNERSQPSETDRQAERETRWRSLDDIEQDDADEPFELTEEAPSASAPRGGRRWYDEPTDDAPEEPAANTERHVSAEEMRRPTSAYRNYRPVPEEDIAYGGDAGVDRGDDILELSEDDEVLELTEIVEDEPPIEMSGPESDAGDAPEEPEAPDMLALEDPLPDDPLPDEPVAHDEPARSQEELPLELTPDMEISDEIEAEADIGSGTPAGPAGEPEHRGAATAEQAGDDSTMPMNSMFREAQRGNQPSPAVAHAFSRLRQTMASESDRRTETRGEGAAPPAELQGNLEQLLRPMIKEWLDENLPQTIERLVREEASRVAKGPEND